MKFFDENSFKCISLSNSVIVLMAQSVFLAFTGFFNC